MAYFAQIENNVVTNVIAISNEVLNEPENTYPETEPSVYSRRIEFAGFVVTNVV